MYKFLIIGGGGTPFSLGFSINTRTVFLPLTVVITMRVMSLK